MASAVRVVPGGGSVAAAPDLICGASITPHTGADNSLVAVRGSGRSSVAGDRAISTNVASANGAAAMTVTGSRSTATTTGSLGSPLCDVPSRGRDA